MRGALRLAAIAGCCLSAALAPLRAAPQTPVESGAEMDDRIALRITSRMAGQVSLNLEGFEVQVSNSVVTITGSVASVGEKRHVERLVNGVVGVAAVRNNLTIRPTDRGDLGIRSDVDVLLERRTRFRDNPITATVNGTEVTLSGKTDRALDRLDAEDLTARVSGVTRVINNIEVTGPAASKPDVAARVLSLLVNPLTFGVARDLDVQIDDRGVVILAGSVERESDRVDAGRLALTVPGVTAVDNRLIARGR